MQVKKYTDGGYSRRLGLQLLDALLVRGKRIFTSQEARQLAATLGFNTSTAPWLLHELVRGGWIDRIRQGLYVVDETRRGGATAHPFAIATALVEPSAISHWSALAHHGLTSQIPRIVTASTPKDIVTPRMREVRRDPTEAASTWEVAGLRYRYIRVQPRHFWGFDQVWIDENSRVPIMDRERTVLDGFVAPDVFGSLNEIVGVLEEHLAKIDVERLVGYALRYSQQAAIKRIGYVLEQFDISPEVIQPLRDLPIRGYRLLNPQGPNTGPYVASWRLRVNLPGVATHAC